MSHRDTTIPALSDPTGDQPGNPAADRSELRHINVLDGWRALSILLVIAGHLLPIGPSRFELNAATAASGMVMFFTLSGFLITRFLIEDGNLRRFLLRRLFRIVPLAWLGMTLALIVGGGTAAEYAGNLLFFANLPPFFLLPAGAHFWSLCVEVQFYLSIAVLVAIGGERALRLVPLFALGVTAGRIAAGAEIDIVTWFRIDEILAGATLALVFERKLGEWPRRMLMQVNFFWLLPLLFLSAWPAAGWLNYARPYISAVMIGASIYHAPGWVRWLSGARAVTYVARTSFALYVFHGILTDTWLGAGEKLAKYMKRPLLIAVTTGCAHLSTFHYERYWMNLARRLTARPRPADDRGARPTA